MPRRGRGLWNDATAGQRHDGRGPFVRGRYTAAATAAPSPSAPPMPASKAASLRLSALRSWRAAPRMARAMTPSAMESSIMGRDVEWTPRSTRVTEPVSLPAGHLLEALLPQVRAGVRHVEHVAQLGLL